MFVDVPDATSNLLFVGGTAWCLYILAAKVRFVKLKDVVDNVGQEGRKRFETEINRILYVLIGIAIIAYWVVAISQFIIQSWLPAEMPIRLTVAGVIALFLVVNVPLLLFVKRWHTEKQTCELTVGSSGKLTVVWLAFVMTAFFSLLATLSSYLARGNNEPEVLLLLPALGTVCSVLAVLSSRHKAVILEDSLMIRPRLGKVNEVAYEDIWRASIDKYRAISVYSDDPTFPVFVAPKKSFRYDELLSKLKEKGVEIKHKQPTDPEKA